MIDVKKEIIAKHDNGVRVSDLATQFGMAKSTNCTILRNRETIKKADVARGVTVIPKQRSQTIEKVEKLLLIWINDNMLDVVTDLMVSIDFVLRTCTQSTVVKFHCFTVHFSIQ